MSTPYVRRPVLEGNTDVPVQAQPYLQGTVRKTSAGVVPGFSTLIATANADFVVESEAMGGGPTTVTFAAGHSDLLVDILATINAVLTGTATATERDGCIRLQTVGVGETALGVKSFIRVHPATTDYDADGVPNDCSTLFGFASYPDPAATVAAGDVESAATRPVEQANLPGTRFIARGEDRTSAAFNRALSQLALNADIIRTAATREAYYPLALTVDFSDTNWDVASGRLRFDGSGRVTQVKLADLDAVNAQLSGRLYVGGLSRSATLQEISKYWGITDSAGNELLVYDDANDEIRTLRIGAVTRGECGFGRPDFADETSAPAILFPDTANVTPDGGNALGVFRLKQPTTAITGIKGKTSVVCSSLTTPGVAPTTPAAGVGFLTHGVSSGDIALISGATTTSPFCHNGAYYVEGVVTEQELILRPLSDTDVESLNPSESGTFGSIAVYGSGEWSSDIWVTLDPPLSRFPEDNKIVITFGIERETLNQREDVADSYTDTSAVQRSPSDPQLTGFQSKQFWQRQSLGGAYAGMSGDRTADAGSIIKARKRPITVVAPEKTAPSAGTYVRGPFSGTLVGAGVLVAESAAVPPHPDTFTMSDVGRVVKMTGGALIDLEPFLITEFIDGSHVRLAPLGAEPGIELESYGVIDYEVYDDVVDYPGSLLMLVAPEEDRAENELADIGVLYVREQNGAGGPPSMPTRQHGRSLLHLERVTVGYVSPGTATSLRSVVITGATATTVTVGASVESFQNIFAVEGGDTRPVEAPYNGGSVFRILNGPNAGFYLIQKTTSANELTLRTLDGESVLLDTTVTTTQIGAFYNAHVAVGHKLAGTGYGDVEYRTAKLRVFFDSLEQGDASGVGLSLDWKGEGAGIAAQLNDADFIAYDSEAGTYGYVIDVNAYVPLTGVIRASITADVSSADSDKREAKASTLWAATNSVDFDIDASDEPNWRAGASSSLRPDTRAWGSWIHQEGSDSALLVTRGATGGNSSTPINGEDLLASSRAALVVQDLDGLDSAMWGAIGVAGGIYQYQVAEGHAGLHTEAGVAAGSWVTPSYRPVYNSFDPETHASLGLPEIIHTHDTSLGALERRHPDFSKFRVPHIGVYAFTYKFWSGSIEALNGQRIYDSTVTNRILKIVGLYFDEGNQELWLAVDGRLAVRDPVFTGVTTVGSSQTVRILGRRWDNAYLDISEFSKFGTALVDEDGHIATIGNNAPIVGDVTELPIVGAARRSEFSALNDTAYDSSFPADTWPHAQNVLHPSTLLFGTAVEGSLTGFKGESVTVADSYDEFATGYALPAFPNAAAISNYEGGATGVTIDGVEYARTLNDVYYGGNLGNHDFCLVNSSQVFEHGISATWDNANGGMLRFYVAQDSGGLSPIVPDPPASGYHGVYVFQRGVTDVSYVSGKYKAYARYVLRNRATGAVLPSGSVIVTFYVRGGQSDVFGTDNDAVSLGIVDRDDYGGEVIEVSREITFDGLGDRAVGSFANDRSSPALEQSFHIVLGLSWRDTAEDIEIWLCDFGVEQLTAPIQIDAPARVSGLVSATDYTYLGTRRGFVTVAPPQIGWLNSSEFFQHRHSSSTPSENGYYFSRLAAHMGVGSVQGTLTFDNDTGMPIKSAIFRPLPAVAALFNSGMYGATFRTMQPFYDPLWYMQSRDSDFTTSGSTPCGPTGFIIPVDVPHGARITGVDLVTEVTRSILAWHDPLPEPRVDDPGDPTVVSMTYQFFVPDEFSVSSTKNMEQIYADGDQNSLKNLSAWTRGFRVRLWRHRSTSVYSSRFGDPEFRDSAGREIRAGWPEAIWSRTVPLDDTVFTDFEDTVAEPELLDLSWDLFRDAESNTQEVSVSDVRALMADRRSYDYFITVEFYAGARTAIGTLSPALYQAEFAHFFSPLRSWYGGNTVAPTSNPQNTFATTGWYYGAGFDINEATPGDTLGTIASNYKLISIENVYPYSSTSVVTTASYVPGTFTIRGLRLTYETNKPRH